jgi:hypothetical protein
MKARQALALIILAVAWSVGSVAVLAQEGPDLVRVDFLDEEAHAAGGGVFGADPVTLVVDDVLEPLMCEGDSENFDYASGNGDAVDNCDPVPAMGVRSTVSGGGRWKIGTGWGDVERRAIGFNFSNPADGGAGCAALAALALGGELGGDTCNCSTNCYAQVDISADRAFKKGATRQTLDRFYLWKLHADGTYRPVVHIDHLEPLYICEDPFHRGERDWRLLQTESCDGSEDVSFAEVVGASANDQEPIGAWHMPMKILLHRVANPGGDGGDGGGGGGSCELKAKGAPCSFADECCSGKCGGKPGANTCK